MCTIFFAYKIYSNYPLIYLGNRDEFYNRPTLRAKFYNNVFMGKDLRKGGTWFGFHKNGRIGFLTNYRDMADINENASTRGHLITNYLNSQLSPREYLKSVDSEIHKYNGFNLVLGSFDELIYYSSVQGECQTLEPGIYGLSNSFLNTPWFKVEKGIKKIKDLELIDVDRLFKVLSDQTLADDSLLPETGLPYEAEKALSSIFVSYENYGTVSQQVILYDGRCIEYYDRIIDDQFTDIKHTRMIVGEYYD